MRKVIFAIVLIFIACFLSCASKYDAQVKEYKKEFRNIRDSIFVEAGSNTNTKSIATDKSVIEKTIIDSIVKYLSIDYTLSNKEYYSNGNIKSETNMTSRVNTGAKAGSSVHHLVNTNKVDSLHIDDKKTFNYSRIKADTAVIEYDVSKYTQKEFNAFKIELKHIITAVGLIALISIIIFVLKRK